MKYSTAIIFFLWIYPVANTDCQISVEFTETWALRTNPARGQTVLVDQNNSDVFYFANKEAGLKIFSNHSDSDPMEIAHFPTDSLRGMDAMNLFQKDTFLFVSLGDFFSETPKLTGMAILNVADPGNAFITDIWSTPTAFRGSPYVASDGNQAWLCVMEHGIVFLDVSEKSKIDSLTVHLPNIQWPLKDPGSTQRPNTRFVEKLDSLMYVCFDAGGLRILNVSDINNITEISRYINPLNEFTQQAYNSMYIDFPYAYIALDYCGFEVVDISDINDVKHVTSVNPWECEDGVWLFNEGHNNQISFDDEHELIYFSSGASEVVCYDVSNPESPRLVGEIGGLETGEAAWGVTVKDMTAYVTYIESVIPFFSIYSGLKVFDISIDSSTTGIINLGSAELGKAYPNPFHESLNFEIHPNILNGTLTISNLLGQEMYSTKLATLSFDLSEVSTGTVFPTSGVYYVNISKGVFQQSFPIIKLNAQ